jgi:hypothetical protein
VKYGLQVRLYDVGGTSIFIFKSTHFERVGVGVSHGWMAARLTWQHWRLGVLMKTSKVECTSNV